MSVDWDVDLDATCGLCHSNSPTSNSHEAHIIRNADIDHTDCDVCHPSVGYAVAATGTDLDFISGNHADGGADFNAGIADGGSGGTATCTGSCHLGDAGVETWDNTTVAISCNACHYYDATPTVAENGDDLTLTHDAHFFGAPTNIVCTDCHANNTGETAYPNRLHITSGAGADGVVLAGRAEALQDEATATVATSDPDPGMATCDNGLCHDPSAGAYSATWNATNDLCTFCHSDSDPGTGSHNAHVTYDASYVCTDCHADNAGVYTHMNRVVTLAGGLVYGGDLNPPYVASFGSCTTNTCHDTASDPAWNTSPGDCAVCHLDAADADDFDAVNKSASEVRGTPRTTAATTAPT